MRHCTTRRYDPVASHLNLHDSTVSRVIQREGEKSNNQACPPPSKSGIIPKFLDFRR